MMLKYKWKFTLLLCIKVILDSVDWQQMKIVLYEKEFPCDKFTGSLV